MKKKVTLIINNFWSPAVYLTGVKSILSLALSLSRKNIDVTVLSSINIWDKSLLENKTRNHKEIRKSLIWINKLKKNCNIKIKVFYVPIILRSFSLFNFIYLRLFPLFYFLFKKNTKGEILHEFSSSPIMLLRSIFFKKILKIRVIHTFLTLPNNLYKKKKLKILSYFVKGLSIVATNKKQTNKLKMLLPYNRIDYLSIGYSKQNDNYGNFPKISKQSYKVISFLGPLRNIKGYQDFVDLAETFQKKKKLNFKFLLACHPLGTEVEHNKNLYRIKKMNLKNIILFDKLINKNFFFNKSNILIFPQTTLDGATGHPVTLLEAMGYNKFCIVNNISGLKELINNSNGIVCNTSDTDKLYKIIINLFLKKKIKNINNDSIMKKHNINYVTNQYIRKYFKDEKKNSLNRY